MIATPEAPWTVTVERRAAPPTDPNRTHWIVLTNTRGHCLTIGPLSADAAAERLRSLTAGYPHGGDS